MIDENDPVLRAIRAPYQELSARLESRLDQILTEYQQQRAELDSHWAEQEERAKAEATAAAAAKEPPPEPVRPTRRRRARAEPEDPSETGYYNMSNWMRR